MKKSTNVTIYGAMWCPDCKRVKRFLAGHRVEYRSLDIEHDAKAKKYVEKATNGDYLTPP